jgi:hypothetical protein
MSDDADRLLSGRAWHDFCDRLKDAGDTILGDDFPDEPRERAEGFRSLTRLLSYAMRMEIECGDPAFPQLCRYEEPHNQWGGPNPDNTYLRAAIHPDYDYRVWGNLTDMRQIIVSLQEGDMQLRQFGVYSEQGLDDWHVGPNGEFELFISRHNPGRSPDSALPFNWMPMHDDARIFQVRTYLSDWVSDSSPTLHIERIGAEGIAPPPLDPAALAAALDRTANWVEVSSSFWNDYTAKAWQRGAPNQVSPARSTPGGAENILYGSCFWQLEEDEALVFTCEEPEAQYYNFCIHTLGWLESGDFANRQVSLSGHQLHIDDDGFLRIALSARDPGVPNWIDTEGRRRGLFAYRWVWATSGPEPTGEVVKVDAVRELMPEGHPVIDETERRRRLSKRREHFWDRYL